MKKILFFAAVMGVAFTSCMNEEFIGDNSPTTSQGTPGAISFAFDVPQATRADGAAAATKLNNQFIVWGEKSETASAPATGNLVFPDYKVTYGANTAYTTTSNTKDWEYVGLAWTGAEAANIKEANTAVTTNAQTIKFWDYAATSYTFTAVSAKPADISDGKVKFKKLTSGTTVYDKGYEVTVTDMADLTSLYFADRVNIAQSSDKDRTKENKYGGNVKFTFRNAVSQVRVGMYETIPGYDVKVTKFYYAASHAGTTPAFSDMTSFDKANFVADVPNVSPDVANSKTSVAGTFTVKYYPQSTENDAAGITNHPTISFTPTATADSKITLSLGAGVYNTTLATSSATPTYDQAGAYTTVFPQETNATNLKLKIDYQLSNTVTGEIINITGKTAEVPAEYLQWKPNFKYTYLFKITDDDLYPITFDAVEVVNEDGLAEYITTVCEPSITTFGVKVNSSDAFLTYVAGGCDYQRPTGTDKLDIYATIVENGSVITPTEGTNVNYYSIAYKDGATAVEKTEKPITESSVAESIAEKLANPSLNPLIVCTKNNDLGAPVTTVPGEDGVNITGTNAVKFENLAAGIYAIEYITTQTYNTTSGTYDFADQTAFDDYVAANGTLYNDVDGLTETTWAHYNTDATTTYYHRAGIKKHAKTYKVIVVQ